MADRHASYLANAPDDTPPAAGRRPVTSGFRFTIGGLLVLTAATAVVVGSLFAFPPIISAAVASLMAFCLPAMLVGCVIYGGPGWRALAIGALLPSVLRLVSTLFGGGLDIYGRSASARLAAMQQQMELQFLQQTARQARMGMGGQSSLGPASAFDYIGHLAETWDKLGYVYITNEALFWGGSALAGLATLLVQQRFARAGIKR